MKGLALMRLIDCRTSSSTSGEGLWRPFGLDSGLGLDIGLEGVVGEGEHAAVGVVDEDDLLGSEQPLGDRQRADLVVGHDAAGVADDVRVALLEAEQAVGVQPRVHARDNRDLAPGRHGQIALVKVRGVRLRVGQQLVCRTHLGSFRNCLLPIENIEITRANCLPNLRAGRQQRTQAISVPRSATRRKPAGAGPIVGGSCALAFGPKAG
jgi:hypothetical protein